ncbi:ADP-ribosyltransferase [Nocardiopsis algeriensis]|uniref:ADP-ribosyltransferase n=1 Tax=Nocardiopsis algeriensis TaxID=1478215 RepID=UPI003B43998C
MDPDQLETVASQLVSVAGDIGQSGTDITTSWASLSSFYSAPEAETLFAKMDPVDADTSDVQEAVETVAAALTEFAEEARTLKAELISLKGQAQELQADIDGDPDWAEDEDLRGRNNALNNRVASAVFDYQYAERNCANKITALFGGTRFMGWSELMPADPGTTEDGRPQAYYGTFKEQVDADNPWGSSVDAPEDTNFLTDPFDCLFDLGVGAAVGIGSALGVYREGEDRFAYPFGTEWRENIGAHYGELTEGYATLTGFYVDGRWTGHDSVDEWYAHFREPAGELLGSLVAYDEWQERPAYAVTHVAVNGLLMAGGVGLLRTGLSDVRSVTGDISISDQDAGSGISFPEAVANIVGNSPLPGTVHGGSPFTGATVDLPSLDGAQGTLTELKGLDATGTGSAPALSGPDAAATGSTDTGTPTANGPSPDSPPRSADTTGTTADTEPPAVNASDTHSTAPAGGGTDIAEAPDGPWTASPVNDTNIPGTGTTDQNLSSRTDTVSTSVPATGDAHTTIDTSATDTPEPSSGTGDGGSGDGGPDTPADSQGGDQGQGGDQQTGSANGGDPGSGSQAPSPPVDPSAFYPGDLDRDGIRRFPDDADVDAYAQQVLLDPTVNPHAFDNLPREQQDAVLGYTTNSWINNVARAGDAAAGQRLLDSWVNRANASIARGEMGLRGWDLYELNGRVKPTLADLQAARARTDLTPNQRSLVEEIFAHKNPRDALGYWLKRTGPLGVMAETNGGRYPDVNDAYALMRNLDPAVQRPLPEGVEAVRGLHSLDHLDGFDPNNIGALIGTTQVERGYMSTSLGNTLTTVDGKPFIFTLNLDVPSGAQGVWVGVRSRYPNQRELVLARGTRYIIDDVRLVSGRYVIDATVVV